MKDVRKYLREIRYAGYVYKRGWRWARGKWSALSSSTCSVIVPLLCHRPPPPSSSLCFVIVPLLCHHPPALSSSPSSVFIPLLCHRPPALSSHLCSVTIHVLWAGIACWLERRTRDRKVASSNPGRSGGRIFFFRVNFVFWLSVFFGVRPPPCYRSGT